VTSIIHCHPDLRSVKYELHNGFDVDEKDGATSETALYMAVRGMGQLYISISILQRLKKITLAILGEDTTD
jgi:hypothetical protein